MNSDQQLWVKLASGVTPTWHRLIPVNVCELMPGQWVLEAWLYQGETPNLFRRISLLDIQGFSSVDPTTLITTQRGGNTIRIYPDGRKELAQ